MSRRRKIGLCVFLGVAIAAIGFLYLRPSEPVYQGKRLSEWFKDFDNWKGEEEIPAVTAVRAAGTNAVPLPVAMLRDEDSRFKLYLKELAERQSLIKLHFNRAEDLHLRAANAALVLGPLAKEAVPDLAAILHRPVRATRADWVAARALAQIGAEGIVALTTALADEDSYTRTRAAFALGLVHSDAEAIVPALVRAVRDQHANVRNNAIDSLGMIGKGPDLVVPALLEALSDSDGGVRGKAAIALTHFLPQAKAAVPMLTKNLQDSNPNARHWAGYALKQIEPEAAAKAGVK